MCGFAGVVRSDRPIEDSANVAAQFDAALAHRGPDGRGCWIAPDGQALLVHRRLAIIDPTPDGAQPMATPDGSHQFLFNGEVYNYRELRRDLESRGERFRSSSDTEVLLRLIVRDGPESLSRVRGMFAIACWSVRERALLLARDRFGIKPLYVAVTPAQCAFSSELSALMAAGVVTRQPSAAGVLAFLSWGSIPAPLTWAEGTEALPPGTWRRWTSGGRDEQRQFADTRSAYLTTPTSRPESVLREEVGAAVRESVAAHLIADVPVGVFLSGGIDSGAMVSAATSSGATNLQTFTVGFEHAPGSEAPHARVVAEKFGTTHHELIVDGSHVAADFPKLLAHLDQPSIDGVNSFYVSRAVAQTGIKAVLSGAGGDEMFGGYPSFTRIPRAMQVKRIAGPAWPGVSAIGSLLVSERLRPRWRHFAATNGSLVEAYRVQRGFLMPEEIEALAGPALLDTRVRREASESLAAVEDQLLKPVGNESASASIARLETRLYLSSQLLRDMDVMAMAHALEVRVPFVDHELLATVWPALGSYPTLQRQKRLLSGTLKSPLPDSIVNRPKHGFILPFATWFEGPLAPLVRDGMSHLVTDGWITPGTPDRVWNSWKQGTSHWSRPWGLAVLGHFLRRARP
jgi:asparagine synthase (glutamine-hydrolysing)